MSAARQIAVMLAVTKGLLDDIPQKYLTKIQDAIVEKIDATVPELEERIETVGFDDPLWEKMGQAIADGLKGFEELDAVPGNIRQKGQDR